MKHGAPLENWRWLLSGSGMRLSPLVMLSGILSIHLSHSLALFTVFDSSN